MAVIWVVWGEMRVRYLTCEGRGGGLSVGKGLLPASLRASISSEFWDSSLFVNVSNCSASFFFLFVFLLFSVYGLE